MTDAPPRWRLLGAYAVLYLVWGSTYLAIRLALDDFTPLLLAATRFLLAGALLYVLGRLASERGPTRSEWALAAGTGLLMMGFGNGTLVVAQTRMPTGIAALLVATVPIWMVVLQVVWERRWPGVWTTSGVLLGMAGIAVLSGQEAGWRGGMEPLYVVLLLAGTFTWALGSFLSRKESHPSLRVRAGMQMLTGGTGLVLAAGPLGQWQAPSLSWTGVGAMVFLVLLGSVLAFTSYTWLLRVSDPALVGTYAFVNPVVAVVLGFFVLAEPITWRTGVATLLVVAAVLATNRSRAARRKQVLPVPQVGPAKPPDDALEDPGRASA